MRIIRLLRHARPMTRQDIARELQLSMPTTLTAIEELLCGGVIEEVGENASTGGRRAKLFGLKKDGRYGIGIQITRRHVRLALTDLSGEVKEYTRLTHPYSDTPSWYRDLGNRLTEFIKNTEIDPANILGAGLSFPGIIDQDHDVILHSHVFDLQNVSLDRFYRCIDYPLIVENDANCACYAEQNREMDSFLYISLNESVGGALMLNRNLYRGSNWTAGEVGHIILFPGGKVCYCGKKGCADAYLNTGVLLGTEDINAEDPLDAFFQKLDGKDSAATKVWNTYLDNLAVLCTNIRMLLNMDIILGGDIGARMDPWTEALKIRMESLDLFSRDIDYIYPCRCKKHIFATGAALSAIEHFDEKLLSKK